MTNQWSQTFRDWVLAILVILLGGAVWFGRELISPLVIGALLAFVLNPAIGVLTRYTKLSRSWAATIVLFAGLGGLVALSAWMVPRLIDELQVLFIDLQKIVSQIQETLSQPVIILDWVFHFEHWVPDLTRIFSEQYHYDSRKCFSSFRSHQQKFDLGSGYFSYCILPAPRLGPPSRLALQTFPQSLSTRCPAHLSRD